MGFFDVPHSGYGTHPNPVTYFTTVTWMQLEYLRTYCIPLRINHERIFVTGGEEVKESLSEGIIVYYPQYNCIRAGGHISTADPIPFTEFVSKLRMHPKHMGSKFIKTNSIRERDEVIQWHVNQGYKKHPGLNFDFELAVLVNEDVKTLIVHSNKRADENLEEGNYPVMTYEEFKIYMQ